MQAVIIILSSSDHEPVSRAESLPMGGTFIRISMAMVSNVIMLLIASLTRTQGLGTQKDVVLMVVLRILEQLIRPDQA